MESENGVAIEEEKRIIGEAKEENINKEENKDCDEGTEGDSKNEVAKLTVEAEGAKSVAATITSSASKASKRTTKVPY